MQLHKAHTISALDHRDHQSRLRRHRYGEIHAGMDGEHDPVEGRVGRGVLFQHLHSRHAKQVVDRDLAAQERLLPHQLLPVSQQIGDIYLHSGGALGHFLKAGVHIPGDGLPDAGQRNFLHFIFRLPDRRCGRCRLGR